MENNSGNLIMDKATTPILETIVEIDEHVENSIQSKLTEAEVTLLKVAEQLEQKMLNNCGHAPVANNLPKRGCGKDEGVVQELAMPATNGYVSATLQPTLKLASALHYYSKEAASSVKDYGWDKAMGMLNTRLGILAVSGFSTTAGLADKCIDLCLPSKDKKMLPGVEAGTGNNIASLKVQSKEELSPVDKVAAITERLNGLSNKLRSRLTNTLELLLLKYKKDVELCVGYIESIVLFIFDKIHVDVGVLPLSLQGEWMQMSDEEQRKKIKAMQSRLVELGQHLTGIVMLLCVQVQTKLSLLLPQNLSTQIGNTIITAATLEKNLKDLGLSSEVLQKDFQGRLKNMHNSLQEFNKYSDLLLDAIRAQMVEGSKAASYDEKSGDPSGVEVETQEAEGASVKMTGAAGAVETVEAKSVLV